MIFGLIWLGIVLLSWFVFPGWSQLPGGFFTLAGLVAVGVIAFLKDGYSFIKAFIESRQIIDADAQQIENHDLFPDNDSQVTNIRWSERDQKLVSKYIDLCCTIDPKFADNKAESRFLQYCISMGLARNIGGSIFLTQAGVLLFCRKQSFPHTKYHIDVTFKDNENDLSNEFSASILESYFSILDLLSPLTVEWRDPTKREKTGQESVFFFYPKTAIIEALVNFFIHRDYTMDDIGYITIYSDRIEFENPGQSLYPVEQLIKATHPLKPQYKRNPRLVQAFRKTGLNQREGRGIIRIKQELEKNSSTQKDGSLGLQIENDSLNDRFRLIIFKKLAPAIVMQREQETAVGEKFFEVAPASLHQLPAAPIDFIGRHEEVEEILAGFKENKVSVISGLVGMGGIGKTALGLFVADRLIEKYPDGQIFLDLRGTTNPLSQQEIARHVILSFTPNADLRTLDESGMLATYQSILHGKRVLLFYDNARSAEQIIRLIPPSTCAMIVTSRFAFSLPGLKVFRLDVLDEQDAVQLLLTICPRLGDKARDLAKACGFLPLAMRVAGSFLEINQDWQIDKYLAQLNDRKQQISTLKSSQKEAELSNDSDLVAAFELSYQQLGQNEQRYWQELAVFDASFSLSAAAYVCNLTESEIQQLLGVLQRYGVVDFSPKINRYSMHKLLAGFALQRTTENKLFDAQFRHAKYYLQVLELANQYYLQGGEGVLRGLGLFDQEWENIQRGQEWAAKNISKSREIAEIVAKYPTAGAYCLDLRLTAHQRLQWLEDSLSANHLLDNRVGEGVSLGNLGTAYASLGDIRKAIEYYEQALVIDREIGDRRGEGADLHNLGLSYYESGDVQKAIEFYEHALNINREIGDRRGEGATLGNLGNAYAALGDLTRAIAYYQKRLEIAEELGDRRGIGNALGNLASTYSGLGNERKAIEAYEQTLKIYQEIGDRVGESTSLGNLGNAYAILGDTSKAIELYEKALMIVRDVGERRGEGNTLSNLGLAYSDLGETSKAISYYEEALKVAHETGDRRTEGNALGNLGLAYINLGNTQKAAEFFELALTRHQEIGDRAGECNALGNLGLIYLDLGDPHKAIEYFERAMEISRAIGDARSEGLALANLGSAFSALGNKDSAISYTDAALKIFEKIESPQAQKLRDRLSSLSGTGLADRQINIEEFVHNLLQSVRTNRPQAAQYFDVVTKMASDENIPAELRELGKVLQKILVGVKAPDLSHLSGELAKLVREELEK
jgi:tetratricopeptide (TPR) repeat protein